MAIPAAANVILNLILIPRFGLNGALWATAASYALGAAASFALGRVALTLPFPASALARAGVATLAMALAVSWVPAFGGVVELMLKAGVGVVVYGALAAAFDVGGLRGKGLRALEVMRPRLAA